MPHSSDSRPEDRFEDGLVNKKCVFRKRGSTRTITFYEPTRERAITTLSSHLRMDQELTPRSFDLQGGSVFTFDGKDVFPH